MFPFVNVFHAVEVGSVVFDVDHAYCSRFNPLPPVSAAVNATFNVAFPLVGFANVPPFTLKLTVGAFLSIFVTCNDFVTLFPIVSVASA